MTKRRELIPTRWYKVPVVTKPILNPKADNAIMQTSETLTMINLAKGKSQEIPPKEVPQLITIPPPLENIPTRAGTPWPRAESMSENLFESRKGLANSPTPTSTPTIKVKAQPHEMPIPIPYTTVALKETKEKCGWGPNCPISTNIEDWDGDLQGQNAQCPEQNNLYIQTQGTQQPPQKNLQCPQPQSLQ